MSGWSSHSANIRSVRVDKGLLRSILDALDTNPCRFDLSRRSHERIPYRGRHGILYTTQTQRDVAFIVPTRNISRGGLSFLHGQTMHAGQACSVSLMTNDGNWITIEGVVVRCRHVRGVIHEIGVRFKGLTDLEDLRDPSGSSDTAAQTVTQAQLHALDVAASLPPSRAS
jgi:predicted Zn-dependent protease